MRYAIVDLQFGSTGKGQLAGELAQRLQPDVVACAFTPNAGHTYVDQAGQKFIHRAIPNGVVSPKLRKILIGPGAVLDIPQIISEMNQYIFDKGVELIIHPNAVVLEEGHRVHEAATLARIGSTMKGTAEAMIGKMKRNPAMAVLAGDLTWDSDFIINADAYMDAWGNAKVLQIEGTQGYSLSMHHGFWPYVTAKDTTVMQLLADVAVPAVDIIWGTLRTFPIRVANRPEGTSGPCYPDQRELGWAEDLGMEPELTTVTKLPRRIFTFSEIQVSKAIRQNRVTHLFVNFLNYLPSSFQRDQFLMRIDNLRPDYCQIAALGYGPNKVVFI